MAKPLRPRRRTARPGLEGLESRRLLAAFVVNSTADTNTAGTLRYAITQSNGTAGPNTISFSLPANSVIQPGAGGLPAITSAVTIDATGGGTTPVVTLDGTAAGAGANGLTVNAAGVTIKGLAIGNFGGSGIVLGGPGGDAVNRCYIGTDITGKVAAPNASSGIQVNSSNNLIGGPAGYDVISGNSGAGVAIGGTAPTGNVVRGNFIGVDSTGIKALANNLGVTVTNGTGNVIAGDVVSGNSSGGVVFTGGGKNNVLQGTSVGTDGAGTVKLGNGGFGVQVSGDTGDLIGFTGIGNLNIISNNGGAGVDVTGAHNTVVANAFIGLDRTGSAAFGNTGDGVVVENASTGTTIGGTAAGLGNFLSGNGNNGINVETGSTGTVILLNHIGSDASGLLGVPNDQNGILLNQTNARIASNSVLDNGQSGVLLFGGSGSVLQSNYIGDVVSGAHGNAVDGVFLYGSNNNTIGGAGAGNVISSNGEYGVTIQNGSQNNLVAANYVGLTGSGQGGRRNQNGVAVFDSTGTTIGGTAAGTGNIIGSNQFFGIDVHGTDSTGTLVAGNIVGLAVGAAAVAPNSSGIILDNAAGVTVQGNIVSGNTVDGIYVLQGSGSLIRNNLIGTDGTGTLPLGNGADGIDIAGASRITVGGTTSAFLNVIGSNSGFGVQIHSYVDQSTNTTYTATGNVISGDWIGTDLSGLKALGNGQAGVFVDGQANNTVGGASGAYNVLSFNSQAGVLIGGAGATGTVVANNLVGLGADGVTAAPNTVDGIVVQGAPGVDIAYNVVSENAAYGIHITGGATGAVIRGNAIGTDLTGTLARGNTLGGVIVDGSSGTIIGGTAGAATRNIISANGKAGVFLYGTTATGNVVEGNYIGTNATGRGALGNGVDGVLVQAPGNVIGGSNSGTNVISGNAYAGVHLIGGASNTAISGNWIGTDSTGSHALGNSYYGIFVDGTGVGNVTNNLIGASPAGLGNTIVGSGVVNLNIAGTGATGTLVQGNFLGTDISGSLGLFPTPYDIIINGSAGNTIGGTSAGKGNLISAAVSAGLSILNAGGSNNLVVGNVIGRGQGGPTLANNVGVLISNAPNNTVGGTTSGAANIISGNTTNTIQVTGAGATGNQVGGNIIGP